MSPEPAISPKSTFTRAQRDEAVRLFEAGEFNGAQLARRYGIHRDMVYRHLKAVGAIKGRLVPEAMRALQAEIDVRQRSRQLARLEADNRFLDEFLRRGAAIHQFMEALLQAERDGQLQEFGRALRAT